MWITAMVRVATQLLQGIAVAIKVRQNMVGTYLDRVEFLFEAEVTRSISSTNRYHFPDKRKSVGK